MRRNHSLFYYFGVSLLLGIFFLNGVSQPASAAEGKGWEVQVITCNPLLNQLEMGYTWEEAKAIGIKGIEIALGSDLICSNLLVGKETPYRFDTPENAEKIKQDAAANGLITPVVCAGVLVDPKAENKNAPQWAKTLIQNAPKAGVKVIYFPLGASDRNIPDDVFVQTAIQVVKDLTQWGKEYGVIITFENLGYYWNRPEITRPLLKAYSVDELNLCLDPINLYWYGHPRSKVYELVREYIPRTKFFHVKNVAHPKEKIEAVREPGWQYGENSVPVAEGDLDFKQILTWLHDSGYKGYISIEDDSLGHYPKEKRVDILKQDIQYLNDIIKKFQ